MIRISRSNYVSIVSLVGLVLAADLYAQALGQTPESFDGRQMTQMTVLEAQRYLSCKTSMFYEPSHGTQIEFKHPNGNSYLWYPGNAVIVPGKWKLEPRAPITQAYKGYTVICFQYGANTYNPVTRQQGGKWECRQVDGTVRSIVEGVDGDVFGLARRAAVPFRLSREKTTIDELQQKIRDQELSIGQPKGTSDSACGAVS